ncbi:MAG: hypothetical protein ACC653_13575, partial [Gammaproteobacteria bacterium]
MTQFKIFSSLLILIFLLSCSTIKKQDYYYNEIVIRNNTRLTLKKVVIKVPKTQRVFSCSNIAPQGTCTNGFKKTRYQRNPINFSWIYQDEKKNRNNIIIEIPENMNHEIPLRGVLEIKSNG